MLDKHSNAKVVVVSEHKANDLGLFNDEVEQVYVDGKPVDVEIINTNTLEWNLPNVVIKANAYLAALNKKDGSEKFVNVFSNKAQNFSRLSQQNLVKVLAAQKTNEFLDEEHYHHKQALEQFNFLKPFKEKNEKTDWRHELDEYKKEIYFNESVLNEIYDSHQSFEYTENEEMLEIKSDVVSNLQILLISLHNELLVLSQDKENNQYLNEIRELIVYVKELLEKMDYSFDKLNSNPKSKNIDLVCKTRQTEVMFDIGIKKVDPIPTAQPQKNSHYPATAQDIKNERNLDQEIKKFQDSGLLKKELHAPSNDFFIKEIIDFNFGNEFSSDIDNVWQPSEFDGLSPITNQKNSWKGSNN